MSNNKASGNLPTELIDERSFYTLGGASLAVLLVCWAINSIVIDIPFFTFRVYRLIGFLLSETFAVIIMLQKKDRKKVKWLFAFLNGLLIFANASGLNGMTSASIFNPKDTISKTSYFHFQKFHSDPYQQAGIFPLPRMTNWWPDEKLVAQNVQLTGKILQLNSENDQLKAIQKETDGNRTFPISTQNDSLRLLKSQITEKQKQIEALSAGMQRNCDKLQLQLAECLIGKAALNYSLNFYIRKFLSCNQQYSNLMDRYNRLQNEQNDYANQIRLLKEQLNACTDKLARQNNQQERNDQMNSLSGQLNDCIKEKAALQENTDALNTRIRELMQKIKDREGRIVNNEATLVELFKQICAKNGMPVRTRQVSNNLPDDDLLRNEDFYKAIDWPAFCKNFNSWYVKMSR